MGLNFMLKNNLKKHFVQHPNSVGETYTQHLAMAWHFAAWLFVAALCCLLHGLLPFLFKSTGSRLIGYLHNRMVINRAGSPANPLYQKISAQN